MTAPAVPVQVPAEPGRRRRIVLLLVLLAALVALLALIAWYLLFRQPIPLPPIPTAPQMPGYVTSVYGADRPLGIAVNGAGDRIYVTETEGDRVTRAFDASGNLLAVLEPPGSTPGEHVPVYVAIDPLTDEVFVSDRVAGAIHVYSADGVFQREVPAPGGRGWQPLGLAFDAAGSLYVTDLSGPAAHVAVLDRDGRLARVFGVEDNLSFPNGIAVDADGNAYVADSNNGRLLVYDPAGALVGRIGRGVGSGNLGLPRGVSVDGGGHVYVVDSSGQTVFVYRTLQAGQPAPEFLGSFGASGMDNGQFRFPNGIAVDDRGRQYVTDSSNDRIQVWGY